MTKALTDDGHNPDEYSFDISQDIKKSPSKRGRSTKANGDEESEEDVKREISIKQEDVGKDDENDEEGDLLLNVKPKVDAGAKSAGNDAVVVAKQESNDGEDAEDVLQLTADSDKNIIDVNVDNEDSLNLTIGEDEAKIFDEVCYLNLFCISSVHWTRDSGPSHCPFQNRTTIRIIFLLSTISGRRWEP